MRKQEALVTAAVAAASAFMLGLILAGTLAPNIVSSSQDDDGSFLSRTPPSARSTVGPERGFSGPVDFADIVAKVNPAVLNIRASGVERLAFQQRVPSRDPFDLFAERMPSPGHELPRHGTGTGFFIDREGFLLTNHHVVTGAQRVDVTLMNSRTLRARVVGSDPATDLALLAVEEPGEYPSVPLGDSDTLRVGEWVCAIGNPLRRYDHTVTVGVVSYKGRVLWNPSFDNYIQTDAAINFGNSGGPLLNSKGEVVGINTAVSQQGQGIGFAVPINTAKEILNELKEKGRVSRGYLGVRLEDVDPEYQEQLGLPEARGAVVIHVTPSSAAARAGLMRYDVIVAVDGAPISTGADLVKTISNSAPEARVKLTVLRNAGALEVIATLDERITETGPSSADPSESDRDRAERGDRLGVSLTELTLQTVQRLRLPEGTTGVLVVRVAPLSPAAAEGIRSGDVIAELNQEPVRSTTEYDRLVSRAAPGERLMLYVVRNPRVSFVAKIRVEK